MEVRWGLYSNTLSWNACLLKSDAISGYKESANTGKTAEEGVLLRWICLRMIAFPSAKTTSGPMGVLNNIRLIFCIFV